MIEKVMIDAVNYRVTSTDEKLIDVLASGTINLVRQNPALIKFLVGGKSDAD